MPNVFGVVSGTSGLQTLRAAASTDDLSSEELGSSGEATDGKEASRKF